VIAPVDNRLWLPPGLAGQVGRELRRIEVAYASPVPFCALTESEDSLIAEFARYFGRPAFEIECGEGRIQQVRLLRDTPCGNARFVAQQLVGLPVEEAEERAGLLHHHYPCLATMAMDQEFEDTLMHRAGLFMKLAVEKALGPYRKLHASYITPR
jgi:hypothetical protein